MSEWKEVRLGDVVLSANTGLDAIRRAPIVNEDTKLKCLRIQDISQLKDYINWGFTKVESRDFEKFQLRKNDIIIARTGATVGVSLLIKKDLQAVFNNGLIRLRTDQQFANAKYISSVLKSKLFNGYIDSIAHGTVAQPNIKISHLLNFSFSLPPLETQKKIASVLSALDEKIELNNKINKDLEDMSQAIFKSWFVDFEPFGGVMPDEWREKSLFEFGNYINGTSFKSDEYSNTGIPIIKIAELKNGITPSTQFFNGEKDSKYYINTGDILFSWSGNPLTSIDIFVWDKGFSILNQHTFKVESHDGTNHFMYLLLKYFKPEFCNIASHKQTTGLGHVTIADLKRLQFPYNDIVIKKFEKRISPIMDNILNLLLENQRLSQLRDTLLPRLMSDKIDVGKVEI